MADRQPVDVDTLPATQYLILETLAARHRLGEALWTFPTRVKWALLALADLGLVNVQSGVAPRTLQAWLTDAGRTAVLSATYVCPVDVLLADTARYLAVEHRTLNRHDHMGANLACAGCELLARIERATGEG